VRFDSFVVGFVLGVGSVFAGIGVWQVLVTKGYSIAVELVEAGWTARELRAHRKAAVILPMVQRMRELSGEQKFGSKK
jgi:hypothetical protein